MDPVVVVGAGHNGLVCALALARAGRQVLVLERRDRAGGLCAEEEFHPGYRVPGVHHETAGFSRRVAEALDLERHGLRFGVEPVVVVAHEGHGRRVIPSGEAPPRDLASPGDVQGYARWHAFLARVRPFVRRILGATPPPLLPRAAGDLLALGRPALALRMLGRADMTELLRVAPMCAADWLQEHVRDPLLAEGLAAPALASTWLGPWSPGGAANLLLREAAADRTVAGGAAALVNALLAACRAAGVEVRTGAEVRRVVVAGGRVSGVLLTSGEEVPTARVAAACDPRTTFLRLLRPADLEASLEDDVLAFRARGSAAKVHLALDGPLELEGDGDGPPLEALRVACGGLDDLERAFDALKYRRLPGRPHLDVRVPTVATPELAPPGGHVVSVLASFVPHDLEGGWTASRRQELGDRVVELLSRVAPGLPGRVVGREVLAPPDLEDRYGTTGGHLHHGEHALDQLFFLRPAARLSRYATPITGLFLAGGGSHPGGGVTGLPGYLAARAVLKARE